MKIMKNCPELHLKCDILLLSDIFEKYRNNSWKNNGLCPSQISECTRLKLGFNA